MARKSATTTNCGSCRFWVQLADSVQIEGQPKRGQCYRYPPLAEWVDDKASTLRTAPRPVLFAGDWCGEYQKKS